MKIISPADLIPMDMFVEHQPIKIDLVYAQLYHPRNIFKKALYHDKAQLWAHKDIAAITLLAANKLNKEFGYVMEIQDCLRTVDTQESMQETDIVKANPQWCMEPNRLLAPPGAGGHPRGLAIDVGLFKDDGSIVDMGTPFDYMDIQSHRHYNEFFDEILENRKTLENAFVEAAKNLGFPFLPLPSEWWDFRFPSDYTRQFLPLRDADLPPQMQMSNKIDNNIPDFDQEHFDKLAKNILNTIHDYI